ncbi:MAG: hypothetical protein AAF125_10415, partial [Chloroflexota bacterium]
FAQEATPTPNSPAWLGYSLAREAVQDEFGVDLTIVREYTFAQTEFVNGIDDCVTLDNPLAARPIYFGWTYTITALNGNQYQSRVAFNLRDVSVCDEVGAVTIQQAAAPAAAPADNTEATVDLPQAVAGSANTGGFELGGHVLELNSNTVSVARSAGMTWIKKQIRHTQGGNAAANAGLINEAKAQGFKVLLGVVGEKDLVMDEGYIADYSSFVGGLASLGADAIEVWNEPNIDREWAAGQISGANYTRLLASASNAIRSANGSTIVISGAPAPTGFFGAAGCTAQGCNDDVFMQQMADAGAAQYMDCVGLHYNEGIVPASQVGGDPRGEYPTYYFQSMTNRGVAPFPGLKVCYTELGYLSGEGFSSPIPGGFAWASNTTVAQHAAWLAEAASIAAQRGDVRIMIVWNVDFPFYTDTDPMGGYAIYRPDGSCPACSQLATVMGG